MATEAVVGPLNHPLSSEYGTCKTAWPDVLVRVFGNWSSTDLQTILFLRNAAMRLGMSGDEEAGSAPATGAGLK